MMGKWSGSAIQYDTFGYWQVYHHFWHGAESGEGNIAVDDHQGSDVLQEFLFSSDKLSGLLNVRCDKRDGGFSSGIGSGS